MALLKYLKPAKDCLPNPRISLAVSFHSCAIAQANLEVHIKTHGHVSVAKKTCGTQVCYLQELLSHHFQHLYLYNH